MNPVRKTFKYGDHEVILETGRIARQATGSVMVTMDETMVLVSVVGNRNLSPGQGFFPLTVNYEEKTYASGRIPGGFFKREGRPSEKETLTSRLIDRPVRPLFPKGFMNEVQITCQVVSNNTDFDSDIPALIGTSAALAVSGLPFNGPLGAARVGFTDEGYVLNPGYTTLESSDLDMVVAGTADAVLMVESEAKELTEDQMLGAVLFAHQEMQTVIDAVKEFAGMSDSQPWDWQAPEADTELASQVEANCAEALAAAYRISEKTVRQEKISELRSGAISTMANEESGPSADDVRDAFSRLEKTTVRRSIIDGNPRIDGRDTKTVRPINIEVGILPRAHGSALFTRGETQALVSATLGSPQKDSALVETLRGSYRDNFLLHYNFPHYSVGETGFSGGPKRREIGHGRLARRGMEAVLPDQEAFPYTVRVVSEITESNGSSSMASVCGASLSLMDAGVPLSAPVAGVAMGLVKEGDRFAVLTDILGDEDHLGDMDFKVAGTEKGVTALQMDIKIQGITEEIMEKALQQARDARVHILGEMGKVISASRPEVSDRAPRIEVIKVDQSKIRDIIGKSGTTIRAITEESGASVDVEDDGTVKIFSDSAESRKIALEKIRQITADAEVGSVYRGKVQQITDYGAFVNILPGKDGLLHISQIAHDRVEKVTDHLSEGDEVEVVVLKVDRGGRISLSMKELTSGPGEDGNTGGSFAEGGEAAEDQQPAAEVEVGKVYRGTVQTITDYGAFVNILPGRDGLLHISQITNEHVDRVSDHLSEGEEVDVVVLKTDRGGRISLSIKELPDEWD